MYRMLEEDHREVLALVDQLTGAEGERLDDSSRRLLVDRLIAAESRHEAGEEMVFWPAVRRRVGSGRQLSDEGHRQEGDAKFVLDSFRFAPAGDLANRLPEAASLIRRHIAFEEQEVWPALQRATGPIGAHLLGVQFKAATAAAPTRPHPHGPDGAIGLAAVGPAVAVGDRMMDRLTGRRRRLARTELTEGEGGDPVEFLLGEHRRINGLLHQISEAGWPPAELVDQLIRELSVHDAIEREHLYPLVRRRLETGNDVYDHAMSEHGEIAVVLSEIDRRPEHDTYRRDQLTRLGELVRTHVAEEEGSILPALRAHLSEPELARLAADLRAARPKAPTRPHPHTAGAGFGARVSRLIAAPLDKSRDALAGRR